MLDRRRAGLQDLGFQRDPMSIPSDWAVRKLVCQSLETEEECEAVLCGPGGCRFARRRNQGQISEVLADAGTLKVYPGKLGICSRMVMVPFEAVELRHDQKFDFNL